MIGTDADTAPAPSAQKVAEMLTLEETNQSQSLANDRLESDYSQVPTLVKHTFVKFPL